MKLSGVLRDRYEVGKIKREAEGWVMYEGKDHQEKKTVYLVAYDAQQAPSNIVADIAFFAVHARKPLLTVLDQWREWDGQLLAFDWFEGLSVHKMVELSVSPYSEDLILSLVPRLLDLCEILQEMRVILPPPEEMLFRILIQASGSYLVMPLLFVSTLALKGTAPFAHSPEPVPDTRYLELFGCLCGYFATQKLPSQGLLYELREAQHLSGGVRELLQGCLEFYQSFRQLKKELLRLMPH